MSAFTRLTAATNIISSLSNTPNTTLDADQLKAKFDEAVTSIKNWINNSLLSELEAAGCAARLGIAAITGMTATNVQAALAELYTKATATITADRIGPGAVEHAKLATNAVEGGNIKDGEVSYAKTSGVQKEHATKTASVPAITAGGTQTVSVEGVTASNTVICSPASASWAKWRDCGVRCTAQGSGTLTFTAESATGETITVNVLILD